MIARFVRSCFGVRAASFSRAAISRRSKSGMQAAADHAAIARSNRSFGDLMIKLNEQPQVVVMLVEGGAVGGGLGLACVGDVTIVEKETRFQLSETSLNSSRANCALRS